MASIILDAVYGCLIGGAIGDALGAPVEGWYWTEIHEQYGRVTELIASRGNTGPCYGGTAGDRYGDAYDGPEPRVGWFSDDTTMRYYLCLAIARKRGRVTPDDCRDVLIEKLNPDRVWINERALLWKLRAGANPWESGRGMIPAGRQDWIETVEGANEDFFRELEGDPKANFYSMSQRLVEALEAERRAAREGAALLGHMLGSRP